MSPSGLGMIFKALGLDPEKMKAEIKSGIDEAKKTVDEVRAQLNRMEERLTRIEQALGATNEPSQKVIEFSATQERNGTNG